MRLSLLLASLLPLACALPTARVAPRYGIYSISGDGQFSNGPGTGTFDFQDEAGLDDEGTLGARADFKFGTLHLVATADLPEFEGSGVVGVDIGGIMAGTLVNSNLEFGFYNALALFDLVPGDTLELGFGAGVSYVTIDQTYVAQMGGLTESDSEAFPLPVAAGVGAVHVGPLEVGALVSGLKVDYNGDSLLYVTGDLRGRLKVFGGTHRLRGSILAGFWVTRVDAQYTDGGTSVDADLLLTAPYAGVEFSL